MIRMAWHSAGTYRVQDGRGGGGAGSSASPRSTAGPTTATSTRPAACCGRSRRSTATQPVVGRPDRPHRQRRARGHGLRDLRLRRRPRRRLGAGRRRLLGPRDRVARRRRATPATASSRTRWPRSRWASSTSTPRARTATPTRSLAAHDIRETFGRMAMNDEETVALIAGGHTFGKTHGAADPESTSAPSRRPRRIETRASAGCRQYGSGVGKDAITSGLEVTWTDDPTQWSNSFFEILFGTSGSWTKSPAGASQWVAKDVRGDHPGARRGRREAPADHADHRPGAADGPGLRGRSPAASWRTPRSSPTPSPVRGSS